MCAGKPVSLEARLLVCVSLRSSSSRPFHSLRSLLQAPHSQVLATATANPASATAMANMATSSSSSTIQMHVRSTSQDASASDEHNISPETASVARRWLQRLGRLTKPFSSSSSSSSSQYKLGQTEKDATWGACSVHQLWSRVVVLQTPDQPMTPMAVPLEVPVKIDPTQRSSCLSDWPRPSPLPHHASHGAILHFTSRATANTGTGTSTTAGNNAVGGAILGSPALFEYRVVLEVREWR